MGKSVASKDQLIKRFWLKVDKNGPTPEPDPTWTAEQKLPPQWQWNGTVWIWTEGPCWIWTGARSGGRYGSFEVERKPVKAHRFAYELEYGPIDKDIFGENVHIMHACDNPLCVHWSHLSEGMESENNADKVAKGRQRKGEQNGNAKLNWELVREIRALFATGEWSQQRIGDKFGASQWTISQIVRKRTWRIEPGAVASYLKEQKEGK